MRRHFQIAYFVGLLFVSMHVSGQNYLLNPGFEGPDGIEVIPEEWFAGCGIMNTPDTQPGWWNVENKPIEGKSYISLLFKEDGTTESVYQKLAEPLDSGACFLIEIYLAQACQDSISNLFPYDLNHPGDLMIRGSQTYGCGNGQIIADFKQISNCRWKKYYAVFQAHETINYIYLEFSKGSGAYNNGSVLIDNFILENLHPLPDAEYDFSFAESVTLNATTDGTNHAWVIGDSVIASDTSKIELVLNQNQTIDLSYFSEDGCLVNERFILFVKPHIPNVFTPLDKDNINDVFFIDGMIEVAELSVLNRWGDLVYFSPDYQNNWSPENLTAGVYFYNLYLKDSDRNFQGFVSIF